VTELFLRATAYAIAHYAIARPSVCPSNGGIIVRFGAGDNGKVSPDQFHLSFDSFTQPSCLSHLVHLIELEWRILHHVLPANAYLFRLHITRSHGSVRVL